MKEKDDTMNNGVVEMKDDVQTFIYTASNNGTVDDVKDEVQTFVYTASNNGTVEDVKDDVQTFVYTASNNGTVEASHDVIQQVDLSSSKKCHLVNILKSFFNWEGKFVSGHPWLVIVLSLVVTALGSLGLLLLHQENDSIKLWIPQESDTAVDYRWLWENHPPEFREHSVILHGEDVLTPEALQQMYRIHKSLYKINTEKYNKTWSNTCIRVPIPKVSLSDIDGNRKKRDFGDFEDDFDTEFEETPHHDFSVSHYPSPYCKIVKQLPDECFQSSLLELWANNGVFDEESDRNIANVTKDQIIEKINDWNYSELFMTEKDFKPLLGGVEYDEEGRIVKAKATFVRWLGRMNVTKALSRGGSNTAGTGEILDEETEEFEKELSKLLLEFRERLPDQLNLEIKVANSFGEISNAMIYADMNTIILGFSIIFMYVQIMLGRFNMVENRMFLAFTGLISVGMAIGISYGFCAVLGLSYGPLHNMIPFILVGLGIDDMFVIMQCFNNLNPEESKLKIRQRFGRTMRGAGVAITITSVTDFLAFCIGGTTLLPSLQSFCIYCGVGIIVVYVFQATWFVAWMSLDQRRIESSRNGTIPCYRHINYSPNSFSNKNILQSIFSRISSLLVTRPAKVAVVLITSVLLGFSVWGNVLLRQEFNPMWFLPPSSYLAQWHRFNQIYFPSQGKLVNVFIGELDLPRELENLDKIHRGLENRTDIVANIDSWYVRFRDYVNRNYYKESAGIPEEHLSEEEFRDRLTQFLFSPDGSKDRYLFTFDEDLECGNSAPKPKLSMMQYTHHLMNETSQRIAAMNAAKDIIKNGNFSERVFPISLGYATWETDEVISWELYRNILLAIFCIFFTTLILLYDVWMSLLVLVCVILTLVNVGGFMHFWGLTIDTVSCSLLIISIGLCVDYPVHIAHAFLTSEGSREDRAKAALSDMGPAVFNGGFSTFLSIVVHIASKSHVFQTFFKIFVMVVTFGLYNGLVLLPVILCVIGPKSYESERGDSYSSDSNQSKSQSKEAVKLLEVQNPILKNAQMGHKR